MEGKTPESRLSATPLKVVSPYEPSGDQPQAISKLAEGVEEGLLEHEPLLADFKAVADDHVYICIDRIYQFNYDFAGMINDMNTILSDDSVTETTYFYKAGK